MGIFNIISINSISVTNYRGQSLVNQAVIIILLEKVNRVTVFDALQTLYDF